MAPPFFLSLPFPVPLLCGGVCASPSLPWRLSPPLLRHGARFPPDYKWAFIVFVVYTIALVGWYATFFVFKDGPLRWLSVLRSSKSHEFLEDVA